MLYHNLCCTSETSQFICHIFSIYWTFVLLTCTFKDSTRFFFAIGCKALPRLCLLFRCNAYLVTLFKGCSLLDCSLTFSWTISSWLSGLDHIPAKKNRKLGRLINYIFFGFLDSQNWRWMEKKCKRFWRFLELPSLHWSLWPKTHCHANSEKQWQYVL